MSNQVSAYTLRLPARIEFGRGKAAKAPHEIARFGRRALVVHGRSDARARWLLDGLASEGVVCTNFGTPGEPELADLEQTLEGARTFQPDVIVGCGGGSALDHAKALAALVPAPGAPLDYLEVIGKGRQLEAAPLPFVAIPTTAGTGSEATKNAVIGSKAHARKVSLRDDRMLARLAIVDPALTDGMPTAVTLACGLDAVTQVIEPYLSSKATPVTDALCRTAIPMGLQALAALARGEDSVARDLIAHVSLTGGIALANAGLGIVHGLAGPLGGLTGAPHGAICGALLPYALQTNREAMEGLGLRTDRIDEVLTASQIHTGLDLADFIALCHDKGVPRLSQTGLERSGVEALAEAACASSSTKANPVDLPVRAVEELVLAALDAH